MNGIILSLLGLLLLAVPAMVQAQSGSGDGFNYSINFDSDDTNSITITGYTGTNTIVTIPTNINNHPVTDLGNSEGSVFYNTGVTSVTIPGCVVNIGDDAFSACYSLTNVTIGNGLLTMYLEAFGFCFSLTNITIPASVTSIGPWEFNFCTNLTGIFFAGNAPTIGLYAFADGDPTTAYYLPGTTGWAAFTTNTGVPAVLWNPKIQTSGNNFGVRSNQFGFNITNDPANNIPIVVEACTNLANPVWVPLTNVLLTNGSYYFSDPEWTNYPNRFYGLGFP